MIKVLLIEDDKIDQMGFKRLVKEKSLLYDYVITSSIAETKKAVNEHKFDVIIADYNLCDGTALDVLNMDNDIPVIVITGNGDEEKAVKAMKKGAYDYLIKDRENDYLRFLPSTVGNAIDQKNGEDQNRILLRAITDISDSVYVADMKGRIIFVNNAFVELYGYEGTEGVVGQFCDSIVFGTSGKNGELGVLSFNSGIDQRCAEFTAVRKNGTTFPATLTKSTVKDYKGNDNAVIGIVRDITELKRIEKVKTQREIEKRYRMQIEIASDAIFVAEVDTGIIIDANKKAEELLKLSVTDIVGRQQVQLHPSEDRDFYEKIFEEHVEVGSGIKGITEDLFVCCSDGREIPVEISASVIDIGGKKILQSIFRDVTQRKEMESELRNTKEQLQAIINNSAALISLKDVDGRYLLINHKCEELLRMNSCQVFGKTDYDFFSTENADIIRDNDNRVLDTKAAIEVEETVCLHNGMRTYISVKFPLCDSNGKVNSVCTIATDITDRKMIEKEMLGIEERERERIGRDLHDSIGQLLTGIAFKTESLRHDLVKDGSKWMAQASEIETLVNNAISQVRLLAKGLFVFDNDSESFLGAFNEFALNITKLYKIQCVFEWDHVAILKNFTMATHLYRICQEAVNNAVKHADARQILIKLFSSENNIVLTVKDDGIGIPDIKVRNKGIGLRTMKYRASMINALFEVKKDQPGGTIIICKVRN